VTRRDGAGRANARPVPDRALRPAIRVRDPCRGRGRVRARRACRHGRSCPRIPVDSRLVLTGIEEGVSSDVVD